MGALKPVEVVSFRPREWTGGVSKMVRHAQLWAELEQRGKGEAARIRRPENAALVHNVLDAVALGLVAIDEFTFSP